MDDLAFLDDEIDIIKLVSTNADVTHQYILFEASNKELFAINVAKVEELFAYDARRLLQNNQNPLIRGMMDIRLEIAPVVVFDIWYGNTPLDESAYEMLIFTYFSQKYVALVVKSVIDIISIEPHQMQSSAAMNPLTTFVAKIEFEGKTELCTVFDTDRLLHDIYPTQAFVSKGSFSSDKLLLFADDSLLLRKMAQSNFEKMGLRFEIFEDGAALLDALAFIDPQDIGLFLLDLEMPRKSGLDVIEYLESQPQFDGVPVVVHTNMANATIKESLMKHKVAKLINKIDFKTIQESVAEFMR